MSSLPFGIVGRAVAAGLVVAAGAVDGAVVLGDVEIDRPGAEGVGHLRVGGVELGLAVAGLEQRVLLGVVAEQVEIGVGLIGLEADASRACRLRSSRSSMSFHECMPAQQISPSAARRSPWSLATLAASRNVAAIFFVLPVGSASQCAGLSAESMRMTPYLRTPCSLRIFGDAAGLLHGERRSSRGPASLPIAEPPTVPGQTGATSEPTASPLRGDLVGHRADRVVAGVGIGVRMKQEQIDAVELLAVRPRRWPSARASGRG